MQTDRYDEGDQEIKLAEKNGFRVNPQFKADLKKSPLGTVSVDVCERPHVKCRTSGRIGLCLARIGYGRRSHAYVDTSLRYRLFSDSRAIMAGPTL
jgi:hypothetical protein